MPEYHNLDFASIQVRDLDASRQFYSEVFGFRPNEINRPDAVVFENEAGAIFAIRTALQPLPVEGRLGAGVSFWFDVPDVDSLHTHIQTQGGNVISPPQDGPFGRQMTVTDPDGYVFIFHQNS